MQIQKKQSANKQNLKVAEQQLDKKIMEKTQSIVYDKQQYESQIGELDQKIDELQRQMKKLNGIREELRNKVVKCTLLVEKQKKNFVQEIEDIEKIKNSIDQNDQILQKSSQYLLQIREQIKQTIQKIQNHSNESVKLINQLQSNYDSLHSINCSITTQNKSRRNAVIQINTISKEIKTQQKEYIVLKKNSQKARGQILELENQIDDLKQKITTISNNITNAENNKKKAASSRLFNKAAEIVKELKNLVQQKQNSEKQLEQLFGQMKNKAKLVDEQSLKLPELKMAIQDADLKLKKQQRSFLRMRLEQLELLKSICDDQRETDFKAISALQEEIVSCEQQLMRIKAHLKSRGVEQEEDNQEEVKKEKQVEALGKDVVVDEDNKLQLSDKDQQQSAQNAQHQQSQNEISETADIQTSDNNKLSRQQIEEMIESIDKKLEQIEDKIDQYSNVSVLQHHFNIQQCDEFQKAAELQEQEDRIKKEKQVLLDQLALQQPQQVNCSQNEKEKEELICNNNNKLNDQDESFCDDNLDPIPKNEIQNDMKEEDSVEQKEDDPQMQKNNSKQEKAQILESDIKDKESDLEQQPDIITSDQPQTQLQQIKTQQEELNDDAEEQQKTSAIVEQKPPNIQQTSSSSFSGGGLFSGMQIKS